MFWLDAEVEGEERPEGFITSQANESSKGHQEDSKPRDRCDEEVGYFTRVRGRRAEEGRSERLGRVVRGSEDVVVGDGQNLKGASYVEQWSLKLMA